jgi:serine protease Do
VNWGRWAAIGAGVLIALGSVTESFIVTSRGGLGLLYTHWVPGREPPFYPPSFRWFWEYPSFLGVFGVAFPASVVALALAAGLGAAAQIIPTVAVAKRAISVAVAAFLCTAFTGFAAGPTGWSFYALCVGALALCAAPFANIASAERADPERTAEVLRNLRGLGPVPATSASRPPPSQMPQGSLPPIPALEAERSPSSVQATRPAPSVAPSRRKPPPIRGSAQKCRHGLHYDPVKNPEGCAICRRELGVDQSESVKSTPWLALGAVVLVLAGLVVFVGRRVSSASPLASVEGVASSASGAWSGGASPDQAAAGSIQLALDAAKPPRSPIERARNATVVIKTRIGGGAGFFVSAGCDVLTNRHVVMIDPEELKRIQKLTTARLKMVDSLRNSIGDREETKASLDVLEAEAQRGWAALQNVQLGMDVQVFTIDGKERRVLSQRTSPKQDLALLHVEGEGCPVIPFADVHDVPQGETLFGIGNPRGLEYSVTSGVLSRIAEEAGQSWIQTDTPINPGNSGGPLLTKDGKAVGVNTLVDVRSQGIGFAIPIQVATSEFSL